MVDFWILRRPTNRASRLAQLAIAGAALAWTVSPTDAAAQTWNGTTDNSWATATNWTPAAAPATGSNVDINNASGNQPTNYDLTGVDLNAINFNQTTGSSLVVGSNSIGFQSGGSITQNWVNPVTISTGITLNGPINVTVAAGAGMLTFNGPITGPGDITKFGDGVLTLAGATTFAGDIIVDHNGALYVNVDIPGTDVSSSGNVAPTIGGSGTVGTFFLLDGYTLDAGPGPNMVGRLKANGDLNSGFNMNGTGTIHVDFNSNAPGTNDLIVVNGNVNFDPANTPTVFVHLVPGGGSRVVANQRYVFFTATGNYTGSPITTITDDLPMINFLLGFDGTSYYFYSLTGTANFASVALTPNELAVATYLDQTSTTATGDYLDVINQLNMLTADQMRAAFNQMSGEAHGTAGQFTLNTTMLALQQVANHLGAASMFGPSGGGASTNLMAQVAPSANANASPNNIQLVSHSEEKRPEATKAESCALCYDTCANQKLWNGWSTGYGLGGSAQSNGNASGASYGVGGFITGIDRWIDDSTLVGVFGGYLGSGFTTGTPSANVHDNAGQGGLYAQRRGDIIYASALIGGQSDQYTSRRNINFGTINRTATGNYDGWQGFGYSELGANLGEGNLKLQPYGALQYIHLRQNSISETGAGSLNLASGGMDTDSLRSFLGTRLRYDNQGENNFRRFIPELQASWLHEYIDASTALNARFGAVGGNGFIVNGLSVGRDWALLGAGVTYVVTDNVRLTANYYAQTNDRQTYHVGAGGLSILW